MPKDDPIESGGAPKEDSGVDHWFEPIADHLGAAYLRYSFTYGTRREIDHLVEVLGLDPACWVLDVGCGPGRHVHELARRGIAAHGVDISSRFVELGLETRPGPLATFERLDARDLVATTRLHDRFDAVICLCQGAFGLQTGPGEDEAVLAGIRSCLRPGGRVALSAFNAYFSVRHHHEARFDAARGLSHERTQVRSETGEVTEVDLWTGCYTPRELDLLCRVVGLEVESISAADPGEYGSDPPEVDRAEFLVVARRP